LAKCSGPPEIVTRVYPTPRDVRRMATSGTTNPKFLSSLNSKQVGLPEEEVNSVTGDLHL